VLISFNVIARTITFGLCFSFLYLVAMPRKKKSNLAKAHEARKAAKNVEPFKTPAVPAAPSGSSAASSTLSRHSSVVEGDLVGRTRSQAKRATQAVAGLALPEYQPIDVEAWTQNSLHASQEVTSLNLPGKPHTK
jgi:hypothetical protein